MTIKISDSLKHQAVEFEHDKNTPVKLYSCGPTVYNHVHIGNLRAYFFADLLFRMLRFNGYTVDWVMNITDIDDKTIKNTVDKKGAEANVDDLKEHTEQYNQLFMADLAKMGIDQKNISFVKVTDTIKDIQEYILKLIELGFAYTAEDGSTYFSIEKYQAKYGDYGALVGAKFLEGKRVGARINSDEYDKDNLSDFALWKAHAADDGNIFWDHPTLGKGRPGWHIECTLINHLKFPQGTDIHTGGVDLLFPHHTNEIAQAQPIYQPFVKYWLHSEHILVDDKKMSKSLGNFFTLADLEKENIADGAALRYLYLQSHYKSRLNVTKESLAAAKTGLANLKQSVAKLKHTGPSEPNSDLINEFSSSLNDDLNTPQAIALLFKAISSDLPAAEKLGTIYKMDEILGLGLKDHEDISKVVDIPLEAQTLIQQRDEARKNKDYGASDKIRKELEGMGYEVLDTSDGTKLKNK
jgi:cysteinyl-tRNA synthetase